MSLSSASAVQEEIASWWSKAAYRAHDIAQQQRVITVADRRKRM